MSAALTDDRIATRLAHVDEHVRAEKAHEMDALVDTFGAHPFWDDRGAGERHNGRDGVRAYYTELFRGRRSARASGVPASWPVRSRVRAPRMNLRRRPA
jgi:hypothetical protein